MVWALVLPILGWANQAILGNVFLNYVLSNSISPVRPRLVYEAAHICFENKERKLPLLAEIAVYSWGLRRKDWRKLCQTQSALLLYGTSLSSSAERLNHLFIHLFWFERDTSTSWRHLLQARNSPLPSGEIDHTTRGSTSPTIFEQQGGFFYVTLQLIRKDDEDKANSLTLPPHATNIWTDTRS